MIPGFEDNIIGMKVEDSKKVQSKIPKKYHVAKFQGVEAEFEIKLNKIEEYVAPELNEDFFKKIGCKDDKEFTDKTKEALEQEVKKSNFEHFKLDVFNHIEEKISFELPESLLEKEEQSLVANYLQEQGYKDEEEAKEKEKEGI